MKRIKKLIVIGIPVLVSIGFFDSCLKDTDILNSGDIQNVNSVSSSSAYLSENSDIVANAVGGLTSVQYAGARSVISGLDSIDDRLGCAEVLIVRTGSKDHPSGTITLNFDSLKNCTDSRGVLRKGKIIINYSGKRWATSSYISAHFVNFYRNNIRIEGVDSVVTQSVDADTTHIQFVSYLSHGIITFADGKSVTREDTISRIWYRELIRTNNEWHITGTAIGTNKNGNQYIMQITTPLVRRVSCIAKKVFIPVIGNETVTITDGSAKSVYQIEYGTGNCDNLITVVTGKGKEKVINVNPDGN